MAQIQPGLTITLDGKYNFVVLETLEKDDACYALLFEVGPGEELVGTPQVAEIVQESGHEFIKFVSNPELAMELHGLFRQMLEKRHDEMTPEE